MAFSIQTYTAQNAFRDIGESWNGLQGTSPWPSPFLTSEWLQAVARHADCSSKLQLVCLYEGKWLRAAAPLVKKRTTYYHVPLTELSFLGDPLSDRQFFPSNARGDGALEALWQFLSSNPCRVDLLRLEQLPSDSATLAAGQRIVPELQVEPSATLPFLRLVGDWSSFERSLTKKFRSEMRTRVKVFESFGRWQVLHVTGPAVIEHLGEMASVERASAKANRGCAFLSNPANLQLLEDLARAPTGGVECVLSSLQIDDRMVAYLFGFLFAGRYHAYNTAYLPEFRKGSPGKYVLHETIRFAYSCRAKEFDFLRGDFFMKREWEPETRMNCRAVLFYPGLRSALLQWAVFRARPFLKAHRPGAGHALT